MPERRRVPLEKHVQTLVRGMFHARGFVTYNLSQARATKQTPGLPDFWFAHPTRGIAGWWETKRPRRSGRGCEPLRPEQARFRDECLAAGVHHGWGGVDEAAAFLTQLGFPVYTGQRPASRLLLAE